MSVSIPSQGECLARVFLTSIAHSVGNARLAGLEADLGLESYDYNIVLTSFYISYIAFEIPSNILCKKIGPGWFIPACTLLFGVTSITTAFVKNMAQAAGVRFVLGKLGLSRYMYIRR